MDQESTTDIALYDVVDETNKKRVLSPEIHKNYDENDYSKVEAGYTELQDIQNYVLQEKKKHSLHTVFYSQTRHLKQY